MPFTTSGNAILEVTDLNAYYGAGHVLQGCSLSVSRECVTVLGRNGMGKTTLLKAIMNLIPPRSGRIEWKGESIVGLRPFEIARRGIGYVPQGRRLFPSLSVEENLTLTHLASSRSDEWTPDRVLETFPELAARRRLGAGRLSGGEQQMLAIGRALVTNPEILLLDEPSEGLSPVAIQRVIETCRELVQHGISLLLVEQNIHVAEALADRVYILVNGRTVYHSSLEAFTEEPELRQRYLGV